MRKALLLAAFCASVAQAETSIEVRPNTLLRLPTTSAQLALDRLEVGDAGTLLIPAGLDEIRVGELRLGREASIGIAPSERVFRLEARQAVLGEGSRISARGAAGNHQRPATAGRDLSLRLERAEVTGLTLDVRGGRGAPATAVWMEPMERPAAACGAVPAGVTMARPAATASPAARAGASVWRCRRTFLPSVSRCCCRAARAASPARAGRAVGLARPRAAGCTVSPGLAVAAPVWPASLERVGRTGPWSWCVSPRRRKSPPGP